MDLSFALFSLSENEKFTIEAMLDKKEEGMGGARATRVLVMPTHNIDEDGCLNGFAYQGADTLHVGGAPFSRSMFHGLAICECITDSKDVARLIEKPEECTKALRLLYDSLAEQREGPAASVSEAKFSCIPCDVNGLGGHIAGSIPMRRAVDNKDWALDPPRMMGVFQAHIRNPGGARRHAIFVACDGGCDAASNEYYNMMLDLNTGATLAEAVTCEETWWLQKACARARNRILFLTCEALGLSPQTTTTDTHAHVPHTVAVPVCETLRHDISRNDSGSVQILNHAIDTTRVKNGMLCTMHPSEGIWLFGGAQRPAVNNTFGGMFGDKRKCGYFPTHSFATESKEHPGITVASSSGKKRYIHFNNEFLQHLQSMGWLRDYGICELIPIATVTA